MKHTELYRKVNLLLKEKGLGLKDGSELLGVSELFLRDYFISGGRDKTEKEKLQEYFINNPQTSLSDPPS